MIVDRLTFPVQGMHRAISDSWLGHAGAIGMSVRGPHRAASDLVYGTIRSVALLVGRGIDAATEDDSPAAMRLRSVINSLWGDDLEARYAHLALPMTAHDARGRVGPRFDFQPDEVTDHIVVLVHGLSQTDTCWSENPTGVLGEVIDHPDLTPISIRYNAGLPNRTNGEHLSRLLDELVQQWPIPIRAISLVGYSMGGLVIHQAIATDAGVHWMSALRNVISIGAPHGGSPIEKVVDVAASGLRLTTITRPLAGFLDSRSQGIKDLRNGNDAPGRSGTQAIAGPPQVRFHFITGSITTDPTHPIGTIVGDLVVRHTSGAEAPHITPTNVARVGSTHHFNLLHQPTATATVLDWLTEPS
jgi:hypothetical protein